MTQFVRMFAPLTPTEGISEYGDLAFTAVNFLKAAGIGCRVLPTNGFAIPSESRWADHSDVLLCPIPADAEVINVVCGDVETLDRYYTAGLSNVALVPDGADIPQTYTREFPSVEKIAR